MKKSFFPTFNIKVFSLFIFIIPLFVFAQADQYGNTQDPLPLPADNSPQNEDDFPMVELEQGLEGGGNGVLPPKPGATDTSTGLTGDSGSIQDPDFLNDGNLWQWENGSFPTGSGYNQYNGSALQNPNTPNQNGSFPTGSGYSSYNGSALQSPTPSNTKVVTPQNIPLLDKLVSPSNITGVEGQQPLSRILNQLFWVGLVIAVVAALIMIIVGGVQYMTIDAISSKEGGKNKVKAALGGLLLAFSSILLLNTINPNITSLRVVFDPIKKVNDIEIEGIINQAVGSYSGITQEQYEEMIRTGKIPEGISPAGKKILAEALNAVGKLNTGAIPGTDGGNKACAAAVNKIVQSATGQPAGGGLSTSEMYTALQSNGNFVLVGSDYQNALPGDIILSPSAGKQTGHVGIVASQGAGSIISNSSSQAKVLQNHTATSWKNYYNDKKGLSVYIFRPK